MSEAKRSKRTDRVWDRLIQSYGIRVADTYGKDMPKPWVDQIEDLTDEQIQYALRKVVRDTPIHPPTLGQFMAAAADMPQRDGQGGPTIQERLVAWIVRRYFPAQRDDKFTPEQSRQLAQPWTFLYREWIDENRPKHAQRCAECIGVLVPAFGSLPGFRVNVSDMKAAELPDATR